MPNSPWTETGSSISLVPSTTTIGSDPENINYLSNQDKINLMAQYTAELAMKTSLDTLASTWSVSSTFYDNAVAAISTALINAGAPSNWATTWPDGTTSGPWPGIQTSLANLWAQVATQRTALQSFISAAQAAAAQAAATAAAATNTIDQLNTMALTSPSTATWASTAKPALPNASYAAGTCWLSTDGFEFQVSAGGTAWESVTVAATGLFGQILASQLTVTNFDNLIPNPNSEQTPPPGGWPSGSWESSGLELNYPPNAYSGNGYRFVAGVTGQYPSVDVSPRIPCSPQDSFYFEAMVAAINGNSGGATLLITFFDQNGAALLNATGNIVPTIPNVTTSGGRFSKSSVSLVAPSAACYVQFTLVAYLMPTAAYGIFDALYARRMLAGSLLVDGTVTASKIAAGAITADMITTGTLNASSVNITNINANNITAGTLSASKVLFADGSALTTASRVQTSILGETATVTTGPLGGPGTAIPGLSGAVTAASSTDVFNIFGSLSGAQTAGTAGTDCYIKLYVDGVLEEQVIVHFAVLNGTQQAMVIMSLTGLSAGAHTFTFYVASSLSTATFQLYVGTTLMIQRIF